MHVVGALARPGVFCGASQGAGRLSRTSGAQIRRAASAAAAAAASRASNASQRYPAPRRQALHTSLRRRVQNVKDNVSASASRGGDHMAGNGAGTVTEVPVEERSDPSLLASYSAPLAKTFFRLKLFSLGSLALSSALCPALLLAPGEIGLGGRLGLCAVALATSGASTTLIAWIGKPYVGQMRLLTPKAAKTARERDSAEGAGPPEASFAAAVDEKPRPAIEAVTTNWRLRLLRTTIYEPSLLRGTSRPFATWELAAQPPARPLPRTQGEPSSSAATTPLAKLVATTRDAKSGALVGRRWAVWSPDTLVRVPEGSTVLHEDDGGAASADTGTGTGATPGTWLAEGRTVQQGPVVRHYSIHEELLDEQWQVL